MIQGNARRYKAAAELYRQAAIDAVKKNTFRLTFAEEQNCEGHVAWSAEAVYSDVMEGALLELPSAQPDSKELSFTHKALDTISRQAALNALSRGNGCGASCHRAIKALPSAQPEQRWIPVTERLPEEDVEVLITYRYKEGEGDTSHAYIDITTYGQMYFGGNKVGDHKHWRQPFEYFTSNYEVVAWMPLPEPYRGEI